MALSRCCEAISLTGVFFDSDSKKKQTYEQNLGSRYVIEKMTVILPDNNHQHDNVINSRLVFTKKIL